MGFKEAWKALFNETKQSPMIAYSNVGTQTQPKMSYSDLAKEGYQENAIVYRCVNEIANGASAVKFNLMRGDQPIDDHPLLDLIMRPNPMCSQSEFFQIVYSYLLLSGNSYILKTGPEEREPQELYTLRPDRMRIVPSQRMIPSAFEYVVNGQVSASYNVDTSTGKSDVKQIKLFNPLDDYYGLSPLKAASADIDQHNLSNKHNVMLLMNGARPSGAVIYRPKDEAGNMTMLTDSQREMLRSDLAKRFEGSANSGRTMVLEGDFDYKEMGLTPKDMDFTGMKNFSARDIALCFGVPSQLVGIPDANTYSNMQEARLALYEETIIPLLKHIQSDLNEWLVPIYGDDLELKYDIDSIPAITERRRMIYDNVISAVDKGIITRNEARERLGLEPINGGDDVYIGANLFPLGSEIPKPKDPDSDDVAKTLYEEAYGEEKREIEKDVFTTIEEATSRSQDIGCRGYHAHSQDGETIFMPCESHEEYERLKNDSSIQIKMDRKPTVAMADNARQALEWRKEFNRGGTSVGVARARQLVNRENLANSTILRMYSFFSRHEVDKRATGFRRGEERFPTAGRIAWDLWGGDEGFAWSKRKRDQIMKERDGKSSTKTNTQKTFCSQGVQRDKQNQKEF